MAKKTKNSLNNVSAQTALPIHLTPRDHSTKTIDMWKSARAIAENIFQPLRKPLIDLYADIIIDPHLSSVIEKRILQITNTRWTYTVDGKPFDAINDLTKKYFFEKLIRYVIESKLYGHSLIEIDFRAETCQLVPRDHVVPETNLVLPDPYLTSTGQDFTETPFDRTTLSVGEHWDLGLLYRIAPYVILKKNNISDWATFCEVFGMPSRVYFYDPNVPGNEEQVKKQAAETGANAWAVLPIKSDMKQESVVGKSGNDIFKSFADWLNSQISVCILGQTMTTENGSSRSQAEVHGETEDDINAADRRFTERILNEFASKLMLKQGFALPATGRFHAEDEDEELSITEQLNLDLRLHKEVALLPLKYFEEKYNVKFDPNQPEPATEEEAPNNPKDKKTVQKKKVVKASEQNIFQKLSDVLEKGFFA